MNTRSLEYLIAVAEELHFGRAAERCHVSQSALSGQLQKLEETLGVILFERTKRRVRTTPIGETIVAQARTVLAEVGHLKHLAAANADPLAGACRLGMPPTVGPYLIPRLLPALDHYLPSLTIDFDEDFTEALEEKLETGELDLAVLATLPERRSLASVDLYDEPFWVAMPNGHPLAAQETVDVARIKAADLLLLSDGHCLRDQVYEVCQLGDRPTGDGKADQGTPGKEKPGNGRATGSAPPRTMKTSLPTILSLVGAGAGVTLVPAMSLSEGWVTDSGITIRREKSGTAGRTIRLTHRTADHRTPLIEKLADIIAGIVPDTVTPVRR